jgi:hypothetical protein
MFLELAAGAYLLGDFIYHRLKGDETKSNPLEKPQIPRVDEGATIPLIFGRCRVRAPVLAHVRNVQSGFLNPGVPGVPADTILYGMDMLFVVGVGFEGAGDAHKNHLHSIWFGEKKLNMLAPETFDGDGGLGQQILAETGFLGGDAGFVGGQIEFLNGRTDQTLVDPGTGIATTHVGSDLRNDTILPGRIPGYRNYILVYLNNGGIASWIIGTSPTPPAVSLEVSSYPVVGLVTRVGDDVTPADVAYAILLDTFAKLGLDPLLVDYTSFQAGAATLATEGHGCSGVVDTTRDAFEVLDELLREMDGVIYDDPRTGSLKLALVRGGYVIGTKPNINPSNCLELQGYTAGGWTDTVNKVRVIFENRLNDYQEDSSSGPSLANAVGCRAIGRTRVELAVRRACSTKEARGRPSRRASSPRGLASDGEVPRDRGPQLLGHGARRRRVAHVAPSTT